jgi:hypothetical protein
MTSLAKRIAVVIPLVMVTTSTLHAQLTESERARLVVDMRESAKQLDATRIPEREPAEREFSARVSALQQYLDTSTSPQNRDAWLRYFRFTPLQEAIKSGSSPTMLREARQLRDRLVGLTPGLEVQQVRDVRDAVNQLIPAILYQNRERIVVAIARRLDKLATQFESLDAVPSIEDTADARLILSYLEDMNQQTAVVGTMRRLFSQPNVLIQIRESMIQELVTRGVDSNRPVTDCILGTRIVGTANINGAVTANLLPANDLVRMQLTMSGQLVSRNVGYNGPVRLRTTGRAGICVTRTLNITDSGVSFEPTFADANLKTEINSIDHPLRLVRRIAWRKSREMKPQADRIAKAHLRQQLAAGFDKETRETAAAAPPDPLARVRSVLQRLDIPEPARQMKSTDEAIEVCSMVRRTDQIGSPVPAPPLSNNFQVALQIHESAVNNSLGHLLAGRTMTGKQLNELMSKTGRAEQQPDDPEKLKFEMDFDRIRPVIFEARDNMLRVGIRGTRFAEEGKPTTNEVVEIVAAYSPALMQDGRAVLVREGDVEVDFPKVRSPTRKAAMRGAIRDKLADAFPAIVLDRPLKVPDAAVALQGREFKPQSIDAQDGWLSVTVR